MKRSIAILLFLAACSLQLAAQTKKIAHRSHSGSNHTLVMTTSDNFGLPSKPKDTAVKKTPPVVTKKAKHKRTIRKTAAVKPAGR